MKRPLIVLEGLDGSGKATQTAQLCNVLEQRGTPHRRLQFPDYDQPSSALVKLYLNGELGSEPHSVNAYAAASFYAVDRYAGFVRFWQQDWQNGVCLVADRYTTSNLIYQLAKLPQAEWDAFIRWVEAYEYDKLGLPRPDVVLYLDVPPEISQRLLHVRYRGDEACKDIHERNTAYLAQCRTAALYSAQRLGWHVIACAENGEMKSVEAIHQEILRVLSDMGM